MDRKTGNRHLSACQIKRCEREPRRRGHRSDQIAEAEFLQQSHALGFFFFFCLTSVCPVEVPAPAGASAPAGERRCVCNPAEAWSLRTGPSGLLRGAPWIGRQTVLPRKLWQIVAAPAAAGIARMANIVSGSRIIFISNPSQARSALDRIAISQMHSRQ